MKTAEQAASLRDRLKEAERRTDEAWTELVKAEASLSVPGTIQDYLYDRLNVVVWRVLVRSAERNRVRLQIAYHHQQNRN